MRKKLFYTLSVLVCLLGVSESANAEYWQLRVKAVLPDGSPANSWVSAAACCTAPEPSSSDYTMPAPSNTMYSSQPDTYLRATTQKGEDFVGWFSDEDCTQSFYTSMTGNAYGERCSVIARAATAAEVQITTIYAKFTPAAMDWTGYAEAPVAGGKYYIYGEGYGGLAGFDKLSDGTVVKGYKDPNLAVLFTLSDGTNPQISCVDEGVTKYVGENGNYIKTTAPAAKTLVLKSDGSYMINLNNGHSSGYTWWEMESGGRCDYEKINENTSYQRWRFIPEATYNSFCTVESLNQTGSISIDATPTASGSTSVKFNVSEVGPVSAYNYTIEDNDGNFVLGTPTRSGNVITVPVTYTAQNVHSGTSTPIATATVRITAKNPEASTAAGQVPVYVNLYPQFALNVNELDWSYNGETLVETYYAGMEVAASQRVRLQDKLIYNPAQTTGVAANYATWTATITGTDAAQFKFANGTRTVSGPYTPELLDVIFAPNATGEFSATLHVEASYTDANSTVLTHTQDIALRGKAEAVSVITFEANADQSPSDAEGYSYGEIIGTNSKDVSVNLFIKGVSGLTKVWSDPDGVFEFDVNSIDFSKTNQMLTFRAHRTTSAASATNHTATLTVSGTGTEGPVSAVLTLTYQALPLLTPEITWNWANIQEASAISNPLTTTSDGAWTLTKLTGDMVAYNAEAKTATVPYLHHEPATATFAFSIPQTDTYAAMNETYTATVSSNPAVIHLTTKAQFDDPTVLEHKSWWDSEFDESKHELYVDKYDNIDFHLNGHSKMSFSYQGEEGTGGNWTITEIFSDDSENVRYSGHAFSQGFNEITFSPATVKLRFYGAGSSGKDGYFTDVRFYDNDTITADYDKVVLINDNGTIHDLAVTATFSNTYAATVALNAAAQPYFELRCAGKTSGASIVFDNNDLGLRKVVDKVITVALKEGADPAAAAAATTSGACKLTFGDNYTYNHHESSIPVILKDAYDVVYKKNDHGTYTVTYEDDTEHPQTVSSADFVKHLTSIAPEHTTVTISAPVAAEGYAFQGWKINDVVVSCKNSITKQLDEAATVEPVFAVTDGTFKIDDALFSELSEALGVAGAIADQEPVVTLMKDLALTEPATYTIPAGVTLLIPYKADFNELQDMPYVVTTAEVLSAYRTLTLKEGVNIVCNGNICVSGKIMAAGGGNKSAYTTGPCGVINMATGGHIELNNGAHLYCWGYIKGQDMDQGNNRQDVGTVTVNNGAMVHENFELGDWRGGTATSNIYFDKEEKMLFPFQSYALQNIEIPTTYKYGSKLNPYMVVHTGYGDIPFVVEIIGPSETLFLLKDEQSVVRKWYDPTTDLSCYELSGTAQLDQLILNLPLVGEFASGDCNLPISNSMHILLANCNMTLSKPLTVQAGAIIEITKTATVDLTAKVHMFDVDEWDKYIHNYYFRSFNNLTSHKDRGAENSKAGLDDAKFIIDGTLNVVAGQGYIYSTAGGANMMGNGGGVVNFKGALPAASEIWQVYVLSGSPYITWVSTPEAAANLHNEDGSYTRSVGMATFYNINGRWFHEEDKDEQEDHTYWFTYMDNGNSGEDVGTPAVYSHDKTGLEERMKWFNVSAVDGCDNWWKDASNYLYNYMVGEWQQFIATETENVYSCSNNVLYTKDGCDMVEAGFIDENCLYTIEGVKKALVDGHFIPLISNGYDPAYHNNDESKYYICFKGCNWHEAVPYVGESKTYTIHPEDEDLHYIWFNNDWLNVQREEPYFYTADEQTNVKTYYEYIDGEWLVATPFIRVEDALETREFFMVKEALNVAALKKNATITVLRDVHTDLDPYTFNAVNTNCTLDLNGHVLDVTVTGAGTTEVKMFSINMGTGTFTITDNSEYQLGEFRLHANPNTATQSKRWHGIYLTAGELEINAGKVYVEDLFTYTSTSNAGIASGVTIAAGQKFTLDGSGEVEAKATYATYGVHLAGSTNTTGKTYIKGGTITASTTNTTSTIGLYIGSGTAYVSGGTINAFTKTTTSRGIYVEATTSNQIGHLEMTGGTINATATTTTAYGIYVGGTYTFNNTKPNTIKATFRGVANISGGTVNAVTNGTTTAYSVITLGTTTITGGAFNATPKTTTAYGLLAQDGTVTISGDAVFTVRGTDKVYGVYANGATPADKSGRPYKPVVTIDGGTFNVTIPSGAKNPYGINVDKNTRAITSTASGYYAGNYASEGTVIVNDGVFNVTSPGGTAYNVVVAAAVTQSGATDYDEVTATPRCTINGGKFVATGKKVAQSYPVNASAAPENLIVNGGYFSNNLNLPTYAADPNQVITLTKKDANYPTYKYKVAEAYTVTFMNGETELQTGLQELNEPTIYAGTEPTKANTETNSYIFDGWATEADGEVVYAKGATLPDVTADATYYAHFEETTLKIRVTWNANGGVCDTEYTYITAKKALSTVIDALPTATRTGYTHNGWNTKAGGTGNAIALATKPSKAVTYYAQWTANTHNLTWEIGDAIVTTAGTGAELDATGTLSTEVAFATAITAPVVTRAGYTFVNWGVPTVAATMPDEDLTYTAQWTPNTNTAYVVKHIKQNLDGTYPEEAEETDELTGTTGAYVTPDTRSYVGYVTPAKQTVQILADGSLVVIYNYALITYTITFDANGGNLSGSASKTVFHGATLGTLPGANKDGISCTGWFTKPIGGDQITSETVIQRNIGTLYAQYADLNVTAPLTISDEREVTDLRVTTTGSLNITGDVTANNFILESDGSSESGQFVSGYENLHFAHAYFDLKLNAKNHQWYAVAVPWQVDATSGISVKGRKLTLGKDFDIIYYNGERRAAEGKQKCWNYVQNDGDKTLVPGRLYMIGLMGDAAVVRFEKKDGAALLTTTTSVAAHPQTTGEDTDAGWNGVANPALFHAFVNPGVTEGQVYISDESRYETMPLNTAKMVVGEGVFVQVEEDKPITVVQGGAFAAPRRARAQANITYDVRIAPAEADYTDRLFIKTTDSREDRYTIGQDLAKVGVSSKVAQMWVNRYDAKLCVNTAELINETADYPLGISVPAAGDYTITNNQSPITNDQYELYLTLNGEVIWNLSEGAFVLSLEKGTTNAYGLRLNTNKMPTAIDEAVVDAQGQTRKVLINNQIFILRGDKVYSIDGQLVK